MKQIKSDTMYKSILVLMLLGLCHGQSNDSDTKKNDEELEHLLLEIFGPPSTPAPPSKNMQTSIPGRDDSPPPSGGTFAASIPKCLTAMGGEGQCTVPGGCKILLSPLKSSDKSNCTVSNEVCCGINDISLSGPDETQAVTQKKGCGWRNGDDTRILSDNDSTSFAEFPWVVAVLTIQNKDPDDPTSSKIFLYTCGGALIHPRVVMTTAHHVYKSNLTLRIRAGEWDTSSTEEVIPYQDRNVERVIIHEKFNTVRLNLHYDIALLVLSNPLNLAPNVNPICLPPPMESPARATRCISSGWGKNDFGKEGRYQVILKKVELPVVDKAACQRTLRQTRLGVFFKLHSSFMCAGGEPGRDTCKGDGGSPLVCPIPNQMGRYMASGIVAWGVGCGEAIPAVYVDVANMRSWIDDKVIGLGFTTASYTF